MPGNQNRTYVTRYQFDTFNRLQVLTYPDNDTVVTYNYDSGGLVNRVSGTDSNSSDVYAPRVDYDKFGQRLLVDFGNGARTTYAYDAKTRRIVSVKASLPNGYTFHDLAFTYDKVGNLTQLKNNAIRPGDFPGPGPRQRHRRSLDQGLRLRPALPHDHLGRAAPDQSQRGLHLHLRPDLRHHPQHHEEEPGPRLQAVHPARHHLRLHLHLSALGHRLARTAPWPSAPTTSCTTPTAT